MELTNKYKLPEAFANLIRGMNYDPRDRDPKRVSITTLIGNPLPRILAVKHWDELTEDVSEHIWRVLGSSVHEVLSGADKKTNNLLVEEKLTEVVDDITIVGKLDMYDGATKSVEDWKVTSVWSIQFGDHEDWENQLNSYAWLLRKLGFEVNGLKINAILKDWRKGESYKYNDYPQCPFVSINVKLWTFEQQEAYIKERVAIYKQAISLPIEEVPVCNAKERWAKETTYAVMKNNNKTASRVLETAKEAEDWILANTDGKSQYRVEVREGEDLKCLEYCSPACHCRYYQQRYGDKK